LSQFSCDECQSTIKLHLFAQMQCRSLCDYAALSHIAVSKALLINGMFMPKLLFAAVFAAGLTGLSETLWATSVARSHDPSSWERATEKNRST
jgi:hypothetical protein